ncbi:hypothetical protein [Streptomyces sp. NPDC014793]|uniref:hypothetical protein n=1 Tax=Streptomyces sp. NPDC014793 TaxID=3364914 RepID=UPI0036FBC8B6
MEELRKAAAAVLCEDWWGYCRQQGVQGPALVAARQALKTAAGAAPLRQDDVAQTA